MNLKVLACLVPVLAGCGTDSGNDSPTAAPQQPECPSIAGTWSFSYQCPMSASGRSAEVTQAECKISSIWKDDRTTQQDILSGTVDKDGKITLTIDSDGSMVTCTGTVSVDTWTSDCSPGDCELSAEKQ